jgi:hypothetical protein
MLTLPAGTPVTYPATWGNLLLGDSCIKIGTAISNVFAHGVRLEGMG